jgi:hypothetical protein
VATKDEHRLRAEHNEYFVSTLANPFWDWQVTGLFYAAVHYVHVYLEANRVALPVKMNHEKRLALVEKHLSGVFDDYRELMNESRDARYRPELPFSQTDVQRLQKNLNAIKGAAMPPAPAPATTPKTV